MVGTFFSIIPALVMLVLVIVTKRVLLSLGVGIVLGALFIHNFNILGSIQEVWGVFYEIFVSEGELNLGNILLISFLLLLGVMTAFLQGSGGSRAFGNWMLKRVKTRAGAKIMTAILGIIIFIDDYFASLAVGQIARPVTDRQKISRAKLAYIIDSTAAPITVLSPISSWGAFIIGLLGSIFVANGITDIQPIEGFIRMIPMNLYAISAILLVFLVAYLKVDIGPMRIHEERAQKTGELIDPENSKVPGDLGDTIEAHPKGKVYHLILPILVLVLATVTAMLVTGARASEGEVTILSMFANTDVNLSLFIGGAISVLFALILHMIHSAPKASVMNIFIQGMKSMLPAIYILILAWMIGSIISSLETGTYLAQLLNNANISGVFLPVLFFVISGIMALATGTSWGTFTIMLAIGAEVSAVIDINLLLPTLAAVLAGAVFGDHCSPISDTTILSATGAGANHIDHVLTQLPYAIIAAVVSIVGYLLMGLLEMTILPLIITLVIVLVIGFVIHSRNTKNA
ncbi:Na+/H+ antiporter NhaC family protein [Oceanobacillus luteolus]|uniref:Na+/H+ antiporter NhaC family protein n=1 Tax=Oceanobacillus luteolus TaxID=1274358 RepID=A0ABW4HTF7_9BACI|nr:Na+/H+ antiporter NhaC family protein [Oceanobacillus luteolus]MCM3739342.1 Na+/H+ antiporter NhaC family protein [Oceanobacillus luteolus]